MIGAAMKRPSAVAEFIRADDAIGADPPVLSIEHVSRSFGALRACNDVSLGVRAGQIHALIGPNGAGKSTLVSLVAGSLALDSGCILLEGADITGLDAIARARRGLGRSFQVSSVIPEASVRENIVLAAIGRQRRGGQLFARWRGDARLMAEAEHHAERLALSKRLSVLAGDLAHGERRRLELAMAMALEPSVFLLDEPLAGMGAEGADEMITLLSSLKSVAPILLIEHDMDAVFALADRLSVMVDGRLIASGPVDAIRIDPRVRESYLGDAADSANDDSPGAPLSAS